MEALRPAGPTAHRPRPSAPAAPRRPARYAGASRSADRRPPVDPAAPPDSRATRAMDAGRSARVPSERDRLERRVPRPFRRELALDDMHRVDTEAERRGGDRPEGGHELGEGSRRDVALHARERDVRPEGLVVEGDLPVPKGLADALAETDEPVSALACPEPDDIRQAADGEAADAVEDDVEWRGIARCRAHRLGRRR